MTFRDQFKATGELILQVSAAATAAKKKAKSIAGNSLFIDQRNATPKSSPKVVRTK